MINVEWKNQVKPKQVLYFDDLEVRTAFRNASHRGQGAVYIKVTTGDKYNSEDFMLEIATGCLWPPTQAEVEIVKVDVIVDSVKPSIY